MKPILNVRPIVHGLLTILHLRFLLIATILTVALCNPGRVKASVSASGGFEYSIVDNGVEYRVHAFTNVGESWFTVSTGGEVDVLVVGGGGGGGGAADGQWGRGGGGGAGGLVFRPNLTISHDDTHSIDVGGGGAGTSTGATDASAPVEDGGFSSAFSLEALGGGGGAVRNDAYSGLGRDGGSGGGGTQAHDDVTQGSGGKGSSPDPGGDGGSGIVLIRYPVTALASWQHRLPLTFNDPVGATLTNFPALVKLSEDITGFSYDEFASPEDGADLRFTTDFLTTLPYEIELWNTSGVSYVWVRVPELKGDGETIYSIWGKEDAIAPGNRIDGSTWNNDFAGVWNLTEAAEGQTGDVIYQDSTANNHHGADYVNAAGKDGAIHRGQQFSTNTFDYIEIPSHASFTFGDGTADQPFAASAWVYFNGITIRVVSKAITGGISEWAFGVGGGGNLHLVLRNNSTANPANNFTTRSAADIVPLDEWSYVAVTYNGISKTNGTLTAEGVKFFVNDVMYDAVDNNLGQDYVAMIGTTASLDIGATLRSYYYPRADRVNGYSEAHIDEVRIMAGERPSQWNRAEYLTVSSNDVFMTYGEVTEASDALEILSLAALPIGATNATANGTVMVLGTGGADNPFIYVCWDDSDKFTDSTGDWEQVEYVGNTWDAGQSFSYVLTLLEPGSNYTYRLYATNNLEQTAWSEPRDFTTIGYPAVSVQAASAIDYRAATLNAELTATGGENPLVGFAWWPLGGATNIVTLEVQAEGVFSAELAELAPDTTYEFAAWASNAVEKTWSATNTWTTQALTPVTYTWNGPANGNWFTITNWVPHGVPGDGIDTARVTSGSILLTGPTDNLATFEMTGGSLTFSGWDSSLTADSVDISGGTVSCAGPFTNAGPSNRVWFVTETFTLTSPGTINVDGKGYAGGHGEGAGDTSGRNGGGYGGRGQGIHRQSGLTYGSAEAPAAPGSGGGGNGSPTAGGGAVRIEATGAVTINGLITANGLNATGGNDGCGSGGGIWISCHTYAGSGTVRAWGGRNSTAGLTWALLSGGGGRIAVHYDADAQAALPRPTTRFSAAAQQNSDICPQGDVGTLFFTDTGFIRNRAVIHNLDGYLVIPGFNAWAVDSLTISNSWIGLSAPGGFNLTVTNDLRLHANSTAQDRFTRLELGEHSLATIGGNLTLTNSPDTWAGRVALTVYGGETNSATPAYGALVDARGDIHLSRGARVHVVSHADNGGAPNFRMRNLTLASGTQFNADYRGFNPGSGVVLPAWRHGGGYGGEGADPGVAGAGGGGTYGSPVMPPFQAGTGGGNALHGNRLIGMGGGLIQIEAREDILMAGSLLARGYAGALNPSTGGGAGGGIFVRCRSISGAGTMNAAAGPHVNSSHYFGGGGGGRIAVWYGETGSGVPPAHRMIVYEDVRPAGFPYTGATDVSADADVASRRGEAGTVRFVRILHPHGTFLHLR